MFEAKFTFMSEEELRSQLEIAKIQTENFQCQLDDWYESSDECELPASITIPLLESQLREKEYQYAIMCHKAHRTWIAQNLEGGFPLLEELQNSKVYKSIQRKNRL